VVSEAPAKPVNSLIPAKAHGRQLRPGREIHALVFGAHLVNATGATGEALLARAGFRAKNTGKQSFARTTQDSIQPPPLELNR